MRSVISIHDFCREDIDKLIIEARLIKQGKRPSPKTNLKVASLFFENSTRTRVSSETAVFNMGGLIMVFRYGRNLC
jgi:aspartate carbamoyltransferase catalytic subunit